MTKKCVLTAVDYNGTVTLDGVVVPVEMKLKPFKARLDAIAKGPKEIHVLADFEQYPWGTECVGLRVDRAFYAPKDDGTVEIGEAF